MRDNILKIVTVGLALLLAALIWWDHTEEQKRQEYYSQIEIEARPFRMEQNNLEYQLSALDKEYKSNVTGTASLELLFTEPSEEFMKDIKPLMEEQELTGILALSEEQLSGQTEMLSAETLQTLLEKGWSWCLYYDGEQGQEFSDWLREAVTYAEGQELPATSAVYFKAEVYSSDYDTELHEAGISILIHHGEEELPLILGEGEEPDRLWKIGACGWNAYGSSDRLRNAMSQGGNLVFTVGGDSTGEAFESSQFKSMVSTLKNYEQHDNLVITELEQARVLQEAQSGTDGQAESDYEKQKAELEQKIEELKQRIDDIYTRGR